MKKDLLVVPVLLILAIGLAVGYRWWAQRTDRGQITDESMLDVAELSESGKSLADMLSIPYDDAQQLQSVDETEGSAVVRLSEDGRALTVAASLPRLDSGVYQAWMQTPEGIMMLGTLRAAKGAYVLDYQAQEELPGSFEVIVSAEETLDQELEQPVFQGEVNLQR